MITLTQNEQAVLIAIAKDEMNSTNGAPKYATCPQDLATWTNAEAWRVNGLTTAQVKGVMGSLAVKGLISADGKGRDATIDFTNEGFEVLKGLLVA